MNKSLLVSASLALALSSCSTEKTVVVEEVGLTKNNFYFDKVLMDCRDKYEEFFLSEMCYQSETDNDSQRYFVPEIVDFYSEKSSYVYTDGEVFNYRTGGDTASTYYVNKCEEESNDCVQKSYFIILKAIELNLMNLKDVEKRKELLFVYFYVLDNWLASLV